MKRPLWRLNHIYKIVNKSGDLVTFRQNSIQKIINHDKAKRKNILKARQFGITTNEILKLLDYSLFNENKITAIIAHEQDSIKRIFEKARLAYNKLDDRIKPEIDRGGGSKYEMYFPRINSKIYCDLEVRGGTIHKCHFSEVAFMEYKKIISSMQAVPMGCEITFESTPNGRNHFYDAWVHNNTFKNFFFPWFLFDEYSIPIHDNRRLKLTEEEEQLKKTAFLKFHVNLTDEQIQFRRFKKTELKDLFPQEYPENDQACFLASCESAMDLRLVADLLDKAPVKDGELQIYKEKNKNHVYACGVDCAEGVGGDYSVAIMFDINDFEIVAQLRGDFRPYDFAHKINHLCQIYSHGHKMPILAVERNNHGHSVLLELYENIKYQNIYKHYDGRLGWITDRVTRPKMIDAFINGVENITMRVNSRDVLSECLTLIHKNGKIEASEGKHDDCIIASAIALQIAIENNIYISKNIADQIRI